MLGSSQKVHSFVSKHEEVLQYLFQPNCKSLYLQQRRELQHLGHIIPPICFAANLKPLEPLVHISTSKRFWQANMAINHPLPRTNVTTQSLQEQNLNWYNEVHVFISSDHILYTNTLTIQGNL